MKMLMSGSIQEMFMSFRANEIRFLVILASFLGILVKATCAAAGFNSLLVALNMAHSFSSTQQTFGKKAASKLQTREFFLCFVVKLFNSTVSKDCFSQLKKLLSFHA